MKATFTAILAAVALLGCEAEIGDRCSYDADCSVMMDRNCDQGQPGGYCLVIGCAADECPREAVCVEFTTPCPEGTPEQECEQIEPNRGRTYCLRHCRNGDGCRKNYSCVAPDSLYARIVDLSPRGAKICVPDE